MEDEELDAGEKEALRRRLSSAAPAVGGVRGPPGAGKTTVSAREIADAVSDKGEDVAVCAAQNATIDNWLLLLEELLKRRGFPPEVIKRTGNLSKSPDYIISRFGTRNPDEIAKAKVVVVTFASSYVSTGEPLIAPGRFPRMVFDETGQATPEQAWIPLALATEDHGTKVSVYGDENQLLPYSPDFVHELGVLGFLAKNSPSSIFTLPDSYRLMDRGVDLTSTLFYNGKLDAPPKVRARRLTLSKTPSGVFRDVLDPENTLVYLGVDGDETEEALSRDNPAQAKATGTLVRAFMDHGVNPEKILLEATYRPHVGSINTILSGVGVTCSTVHKRLGAENDVVIYPTTRANKDRAWGIAAQRELMNVATSREKTKLVIIGDSKETFSEGTWLTKKMFRFIEQYGVVRYL
jgi:superfamily I DNA and/or RNA helicase